MRDLFPEHIGLSQEKKSIMWREAVIVFDTNVVLGFHAWSEDKAEELINELENGFGDRLWMPNQVALEFTKNRTVRLKSRISDIEKLKKEVDDKVKNIRKSIFNTMHNARVSYDGDSFPNIEEDIKKWFESYVPQFDAELENLRQRLNLENDKVFAKIETLYQDKVGMPFSHEREEEIFILGEYRYANKIPPGYMDGANKTEVWRKYADLIIWLQVIEYSLGQEVSSVILVTNDVKEDWISSRGLPHALLIREYAKKTSGKPIWIVNFDQFLEESKNLKIIYNAAESRGVIDEAKQDVEEFRRPINKEALIATQRAWRESLSNLSALGSIRMLDLGDELQAIRKLQESFVVPKIDFGTVDLSAFESVLSTKSMVASSLLTPDSLKYFLELQNAYAARIANLRQSFDSLQPSISSPQSDSALDEDEDS